MKSLFIFIASFVLFSVYANGNNTSTEPGLTTSQVPPCGPNEEYKTCICHPDLCWTRYVNVLCGPCLMGCTCREGYLRRRRGSPCRPKEECPK